MSIVRFPVSAAPPDRVRRDPIIGDSTRCYSLFDCARLFGVYSRPNGGMRSARWIAGYLEQLIAAEDFPAPFPVRVGRALVRTVTPRSRWDVCAVDRWFDDRLPPGTLAADFDRAAADAAQRLAAAARNAVA